MRSVHSTMFAALAALVLLVAWGCDEDTTSPIVVSADAVPNFSLIDDNTTSATSGTAVSPRDYLGGVSAWYFSHAG